MFTENEILVIKYLYSVGLTVIVGEHVRLVDADNKAKITFKLEPNERFITAIVNIFDSLANDEGIEGRAFYSVCLLQIEEILGKGGAPC